MMQQFCVAMLALALSGSVAVATDLKAKPRPPAASKLMPPWGPGWGEKLTPEQAKAEKARPAAPQAQPQPAKPKTKRLHWWSLRRS